MAGLSVRKITEDAVSVTVGWPRQIGQWGYVPTIDGSEILTDGKRHIGKSSTKLSVKIGKRRDGKSHRYGVKLLMTGQAGDVIGTASQPPDPDPPPTVDNSIAQSWLVLGQEPMDALNAPSYYKLALTADLGYRHWYDGTFFTQAHGRTMVPWCDCQVPSGYHPGEGTGPDVAIEWMRQIGAPFWMGQAEWPEQFDNAMAAEVKPRVIIGELAHMRPDQIARVKAREVLFIVESYRNCSGNMDPGWPSWMNANEGVGGNCIAVYGEGPCNVMRVSEYLSRGLFVAHRDSAYGPQMTVADYKNLP